MTETFSLDNRKIVNKIAAKLQARPSYVENVLDMLKEGNTVPFISRYRKEKTGSMDETEIRTIKDDYESLHAKEERRIKVLETINTQGKLTDELKKKIRAAKTLTEINDLYRPYKPKRKTLATKAIEKGLGPLAKIIKEEREGTEEDRKKIIEKFITGKKKKKKDKSEDDMDDNIIKKPLRGQALLDQQKKEKEEAKKRKAAEKKLVKTEKDALKGAMDIIAEEIGNNADFRKYVRSVVFERAILVSKVADKYAHLHKTEEQLRKEKEEREKKEKEEQKRLKKELEEKAKKAAQDDEDDKDKILNVKERIARQKKIQAKKRAERKRKLEEERKRREKRELKNLLKKNDSGGELGKKKKNPLVYEMYFDYEQKAIDMPPHRVLAVNRGEDEDILDVSLETPDDELIEWIQNEVIEKPESLFREEYEKAIEYGYKRYIIRSIQRELRSQMTEEAEEHAIAVFARNLESLLMQPPLKNKAIIALDPGFTHGTKVAVIGEKGDYKDDAIILKWHRGRVDKYEKQRAQKTLLQMMKKHQAYVIAIGNGTASRETELFVAEMARDVPRLKYCIVNEAGASVYSASKLAKDEFPDLGVEARGAISIARRLQDPLSELIKIDPKSIGVGLYQHDVNQYTLKHELDAVIEDCVNKVGVYVNTASYKLLEYVSGLSTTLARRIYNYTKKKPLRSRQQIMNITGIGDKTFEQCAGFLKILDGSNPLDSTNIHPESYWIVEGILEFIGEDKSILGDPSRRKELETKIRKIKPKELMEFLKEQIGLPTLKDVVLALLRPDRDPRDDLSQPILKKDVMKEEDLEPGMILKGTVRNVVDFGAFVDIGVHSDGLVHISEMVWSDGSTRYIEDPTKVLHVGDVIDVQVLSIDLKKHRIGLTMKIDPDFEEGKARDPKRVSKQRHAVNGITKKQQEEALRRGFTFRKKH